jgi:hypothetical protein
MKRLTLHLTVIAFALLLSVAASHAQTQKISVSVPFDFLVGDQRMPAGQYFVTTGDNNRLSIRGLKTADTAQVITTSIGSKHPENEPLRLVFRNIGSQHYLVQVWSPNLQDGRGIPIPKNRQLDPNNGGDQETTINAER